MPLINIFLFLTSCLLLLAPLWNPHVAVILGHNIFITSDSIILLGISILFGILCVKILSVSFIERVQSFFSTPRAFLKLILFVVFPVTFVFLYMVNQTILNAFLSSADEHSCYFLAETLLRGRFWVEPHPLSDFFNVVHVGNRDGKWFSVYPPGWPLIWALGLKLGIVDWLNPLMVSTSLIFFFLAGRMVFGEKVTFWAITLTAFTPFFAFTGASYFSHGTSILTVSIFLFAFLRWLRAGNETSKIFWSAIACFAVGYGMLTRYLTMAAIAAPFFIYHYWPLLRRRRNWRTSDVIGLVIIAVFMGTLLYQNFDVTGKPFRAPNKHDKSWERLGFRDNYTPVDGLVFLTARFFYLMDWFPPALVVFFLFYTARRHKEDTLTRLWLYSFFYPVIAYFFYFSWGGNQWGPRYYYEGIALLTLACFHGVRKCWVTRGMSFKKFLVGFLILSLPANGYLFVKHAAFTSEASAQRKALYVLAEKHIKEPSIVFIKGFLGNRLVMAQEDAVRNNPFLTGRILYAHDLGDKNRELMSYYPDRRYYRGQYDREKKQAILMEITPADV